MDGQVAPRRVVVIDSHTAGEPTRVVIAGGPDLGTGSLRDRLALFRERHDGFRSGVVCEPRGSEVVVGALLCEPVDPASAAAVIFFNDVGFLGMCGHGTIGVVRTLNYLGRIGPGRHTIETPVGVVETELHPGGEISVRNVPSYRYRAGVAVDVPGVGQLRGDIAWGGNWFFLVNDHPWSLELRNRGELVEAARSIRSALAEQNLTGRNGAVIDHIELFASARDQGNSCKNFVLCPGASFDRSPCGTGTSAKLACLVEDGALREEEVWRQEGILGTVFEGSVEVCRDLDGVPDGSVVATITGRAWVTGETTLLFEGSDPFLEGIPF